MARLLKAKQQCDDFPSRNVIFKGIIINICYINEIKLMRIDFLLTHFYQL